MIAEKIAELTFEKINFVNDEVEDVVEALTVSALNLNTAGAAFEQAAGQDTFTDVAEGAIELADVFDDVDLPDVQHEKVVAAFRKIYDAPTQEFEDLGVNLFEAALQFGVAARKAAAFFDSVEDSE